MLGRVKISYVDKAIEKKYNCRFRRERFSLFEPLIIVQRYWVISTRQ